MFEKFTDRARRVVVLAQEEARLHGHGYIGTEHILLALIQVDDGVAGEAMVATGVSLEALRQHVIERIGDGGVARSGPIPFTPDSKRVLEGALDVSRRRGDQHVGTAHLLLSVLSEADGVSKQILTELGVDVAALEQEVVAARIHHRERLQTGGPIPRRPPAPRPGPQQLTPAALDVQRILRAVASLQPVRSYHYLLALFDDPSSVAAKVLASFDIDRDTVARRITAIGTEGTTDVLPGE